MNIPYTELEKRFDSLTPEWIVSTGKLLKTFGSKSKFSFVVSFNGKIVHKASVCDVDGVKTWRQFDTKCAVPDFVVMGKNEYEKFSAMVERCKSGLDYENPFEKFGGKTGWYIELLGQRFHSGDYVQGLNREQHEKEITEAYDSAGARVLLLWEDDVWERWEEICLPKLNDFLNQAAQKISLCERNVSSNITFGNEEVNQSLSDASYWRKLSKEKKEEVVSYLCDIYKKIEFPYPDSDMAKSDLESFLLWSKRGMEKPIRYGSACCMYFIKSMVNARVKNKPSMIEMWRDENLLRKSIVWQLSNADGSHHARRFFWAMAHSVGFRIVTNMTPAVACIWAKRFGKTSGIWFDPCAGWGSRLLAAHALGMEYLAIDANPKLVEELQYMAQQIGAKATILYGDSSDISTVNKLLDGRKVDMVFTSPPFFDIENYGNDKLQSTVKYDTKEAWHREFLGKVIENALSVVKDDGVIVLNLGMEQHLGLTGIDFTKYSCDDIQVNLETGGSVHAERILRISKSKPTEQMVQCQLCGKLLIELGSHLERIHGKKKSDYEEETKQETPRKSRIRPSGLVYQKKVAYRLPDGSYVRRKNVWESHWGENPPADSIVSADSVNLDPWSGKIEGEDFVVCKLCGFKAQNLTQHVRKKHDITSYDGLLKSSKCILALKQAAVKSWNKRGRKAEDGNFKVLKTHKLDGIDKEKLLQQISSGMSNAALGREYNVSAEAIGYWKKKFVVKS